MYSASVRFLFTLGSLSPALFIIWIIDTVRRWSTWKLYFKMDSFLTVWEGFLQFMQYNYLLVLFIVIVLLTRWIVHYAAKQLTTVLLNVKSIKPADINFTAIVFSVVLAAGRLPTPKLEGYVFTGIFFLVALLFAFVVSNSYHYNLLIRLLGYQYYELQTTKEITYLIVSRETLINSNQVKACVKLSNYMLLHVPN